MATVTTNPYIPSFLRTAMLGGRPLVLTWQSIQDTNVLSSASFQYDPQYNGLKSTQQLNVDWSQFQNHTFFMSAEAKVNLAFDQVINGFPFDGTRQEAEFFFDNLTGFDRWVFDQFPTFHGELLFSSSTINGTVPATGPTFPAGQSGGTYIVVQNKVGALFPELATNDANTGIPVLNPTGSQSMTVEVQLYLPKVANDVQTVFQMLNDKDAGNLGGSTQGFSLFLTQSASTGSVSATFVVVSGSSYMTVPLTLAKGTFNHIAVELNYDDGLPFLESFLDGTPVAESTTQVEIGDLDINGANFIIGAGSPVQFGSTLVTPVETLNATMDEFRVFFSARTPLQLASYASKTVFSTNDLVLYSRFNEPTGSLDGTTSVSGINSIVLDYSGNSLHSLVANFTSSLRIDATLDPNSPLVDEQPQACPVLFPAFPEVMSLNQALLASASLYDQENPNLITRLVPNHYLLEGAQQDGFTDPEGDASQAFGGTGIPGQGQMGSVQILVTLLYMYARFFDEMKLFIDSFSALRTVEYDTGNVISSDTVPDNFLVNMVNSFGFFLPPLFNDASIEQYVRGENVDIDRYSTNADSLRYVQNTLLRRVLKNLPTVLRSKGTQYSIAAFLRAVGIEPNNVMRMREFGGPTTQQLQFARESKIEAGTMVQFQGTELVVSPFLSASRSEPGFPPPAGTMVKDARGHVVGTTNASDGLLTSGSWTWEGIVKFTPTALASLQSATQSLVRLCVTGTKAGNTSGSSGIVANLLAISSSLQPKLVLYLRPGTLTGSSPTLRLELDTAVPNVFTGQQPPNIFDFDRWNVSFGCQRGDDGLGSVVSSSYFLRLGYQNNGKIQVLETTSSFFQEAPTGELNVFTSLDAASNAHGSFLAVGTQQFIASGSGTGYAHLNNTLVVPQEARTTAFNGRLSNVRFWSRALTEAEWEEHVRNYASTGVENPLVNWNYVTNQSGSWGRLRMNAMARQDTRLADTSGSITLIDFSENGLHLTGSGFAPLSEPVVGEVFDLSFFSPYFDEASTNEKVRARSFLDFDLVERTPWAAPAPTYEIDPSERPTDDVRFIMEFSLIDALNRDIITVFATLDALDNAMGDPNLLFSPDYPDIENLRNIYFNRIKQKLNFAAFLNFFRWFDASIGGFVQQLIPRKTTFKGVNFTVESHMFERHKMDYQAQSQIYLGDNIRTNLDPAILLQFIEGTVSKY